MFTDLNDALTALVHALGGYKKVGVMLRPEWQTKPDAAAQWIRDCLNPDKREKLDGDQMLHLLRLGREVGFHAAKHWLDDELGYEKGAPLAPRDEFAALLHRQELMLAEFKQTAERMERLTKSPLAGVYSFGKVRDNA